MCPLAYSQRVIEKGELFRKAKLDMDKLLPFLSNDIIETIKLILDYVFFDLVLNPVCWFVAVILVVASVLKFKKLNYIIMITCGGFALLITYLAGR